MFQLDRRTQLILVGLAVALFFGAGVKYAQYKYPVVPTVVKGEKPSGGAPIAHPEAEEAGEAKENERNILVHVDGAVKKPGVYALKAGSRVNDAVELAGLTEQANPGALNLAQVLDDGQKIIVPRLGEALTTTMIFAGKADTGGSEGKVNINTAGVAELDQRIPGIGPTLAQRIVDYRTKNGPFKRPEDLMKVSGIGSKKFADLKDSITVGN